MRIKGHLLYQTVSRTDARGAPFRLGDVREASARRLVSGADRRAAD